MKKNEGYLVTMINEHNTIQAVLYDLKQDIITFDNQNDVLADLQTKHGWCSKNAFVLFFVFCLCLCVCVCVCLLYIYIAFSDTNQKKKKNNDNITKRESI